MANRSYFEKELTHIRIEKKSHPTKFALLLLDIDNFSKVNNTFGYAAGDQLLFELANHIKLNTSSHDVIARLSGDEFIILLKNADTKHAQNVADKLLKIFRQPIMLNSQMLHCTMSISILLCSGNIPGQDTLMKKLTMTLDSVKAGGGDNSQVAKIHF